MTRSMRRYALERGFRRHLGVKFFVVVKDSFVPLRRQNQDLFPAPINRQIQATGPEGCRNDYPIGECARFALFY